jgi:hypothetical protein
MKVAVTRNQWWIVSKMQTTCVRRIIKKLVYSWLYFRPVILYMKILTLLYEPCHFILGKDPKFLLALGSEMS